MSAAVNYVKPCGSRHDISCLTRKVLHMSTFVPPLFLKVIS
jgi:hypothetical protein